ncbi:MAG TPA: hypothetical protein VI318_02165 [Baekduia sp.]
MPSTDPRRPPLTTHAPLLAWVTGLMAVAVGAVVVGLAWHDDSLGLVIALVALVAALGTLLLVLRDELSESTDPPEHDDAPARRRHRILGVRPSSAAAGLVSVAVLAVAIVIAATNDSDTSTSAATSASAVRTTKDFVTAAVVEDNGENACGYLTSAEQKAVNDSGFDGCRRTFANGDATAPNDVTTARAVHNLPAAVQMSDATATVRLGRGSGAVTFRLVHATGNDEEAFNAPPTAWRIADGAASLLGPEAPGAAPAGPS